ncbi:hypothetical protein HYC85_023818 [Camellia sinensis]|uniref:Uncharacterized protein n=1 Tax=Camellia sinensis TaxID=4442 RepID=A0A7J7GFL4_CAMSI|nr:hypothetical protein HYC85_023818 [Camellia sinensis]
MENKKQVGSSSSSSSFTADVFGSKESTPPPASTGFFASVFPPPSPAAGGDSSCSELMGYMQKQLSGNHAWRSTNQGTADFIAKKSEGAGNSIANKERTSVVQESVEHCPLSSSLYYGGQEDMYIVLRVLRPPAPTPFSRKMQWKMIPMETIHRALLEGTGGKGHFIIKTLSSRGCEFTKPPQEFDFGFYYMEDMRYFNQALLDRTYKEIHMELPRL